MYTYSIISILAAVAVAQNAGQSITQALQANSGTLSTLNSENSWYHANCVGDRPALTRYPVL